jgi:RimJ/RimL family protein N-acetyltransferase
MSDLPTIQTARLTLRPFTLEDVPIVARLAADRDIASTTILIPHPYAEAHAENWIKTHEAAFAAAHSMDLAICDRSAGRVMGAIGLTFQPQHDRAEMGYWVGKPFWGRGFATEAAAAILAHAFAVLLYNRVSAYHFTRNPASGRVLRKIGMRHEGVWRGHIKKWGVYEDCEVYGILRAEWESKAVS